MKPEKSTLEVVIYNQHYFFLFADFLQFIFIPLKKVHKKRTRFPTSVVLKNKETIKIY